MVLPTTPQEVSNTVTLAAKHQIPFVVAGGRHSSGASSSADSNGIVIDMRKMRGVTINPEAKTITAQGGCIWQDVDEAAAKYGLATVGGTVNHTGVGGLTLGGGYGWLSGQYGLTVDNLTSAKVVLADSSIVMASETENADLFWAMRGCGSAFGVAVEFTYQGYPQGDVWAGLLIFTPDKLADVVEFANTFEGKSNGKQGLLIGFTNAPPPVSAPVILTVVFYNGPEAEAKEFFGPLLELGPVMNTTNTMPYEKLNSLLNDAGAFGGRKSGGGSAIKLPLDPAWMQEVWTHFFEFLQTQEGTGESVILFELLPYTKICEVPQEGTAQANRGEYYNVGTVFKWYNPEIDSVMRAYSRKLHKKIREEGGTAVLKGVGVGAYANYVDYPSVPEKVFGVNTPRLLELKKKYEYVSFTLGMMRN